jgi:hypothetical protein
MKISVQSSKGWRLRESPFPCQQTYSTPLVDRSDPANRSNLSRFVRSILAPFEVRTCELWIEQIIFEPTELIWYLRGCGITTDEGQLNHAVLQAENETEVYSLLECALGQWTDFVLFPSPKEFAIYADHDEFTTIFAADIEALDSIRLAMKQEGFKEIEGWTWTEPHSQGVIEDEQVNG